MGIDLHHAEAVGLTFHPDALGIVDMQVDAERRRKLGRYTAKKTKTRRAPMTLAVRCDSMKFRSWSFPALFPLIVLLAGLGGSRRHPGGTLRSAVLRRRACGRASEGQQRTRSRPLGQTGAAQRIRSRLAPLPAPSWPPSSPPFWLPLQPLQLRDANRIVRDGRERHPPRASARPGRPTRPYGSRPYGHRQQGHSQRPSAASPWRSDRRCPNSELPSQHSGRQQRNRRHRCARQSRSLD